MSLRLAASMGAVQTVVSMVLSFISIKITSIYLGPAGLGTLGQLTYFMALTQALLGAGLGTGLVRRTAELGGDAAARALVVSTMLRTLLAIGVPMGIAIALASTWIAREVLHDAHLAFTLVVFAAAFVFGLAATIVTSAANGAKDFRAVAYTNIGTGVSSFLLIASVAPRFGVAGALVVTAAQPVVTWLIAQGFARHHDWWPKRPLSHGYSARELRGALGFVPIAVVSAVGLPLLQLLIRDSVVARDGLAAVGLLQGVMRISDMYLGVASGVFAMYFFPRFSEIRSGPELFREIRRGLLIIVPSVALVSIVIYVLRDPIVRAIFTAEFLPMRELFGWQMLGNTLKMVGWLFGYVLLAKASGIAMAVLEVVTIAVWWMLSAYFIERNGAVGATQAFAATYAAYALVTMAGVYLVLRQMRAQAQSVAT